MTLRLPLVSLAVLLLGPAAAAAAPVVTTGPGRVTATLAPDRVTTESVTALLPRPGGGALAAGSLGRTGPAVLLSFRPDGSLDPAFGGGGARIVRETGLTRPTALLEAPGSRLLLFGRIDAPDPESSRPGLVRLDARGGPSRNRA